MGASLRCRVVPAVGCLLWSGVCGPVDESVFAGDEGARGGYLFLREACELLNGGAYLCLLCGIDVLERKSELLLRLPADPGVGNEERRAARTQL